MMNKIHLNKSHGDGRFHPKQFKKLGQDVILERGILVFHPENIELGDNVYVGHQTILKAYYKNKMTIGSGTWIGQQCFFHSAGGLTIGENVGIGSGVKIITSSHIEEGRLKPIYHSQMKFSPVIIEDDADIGLGAIVLAGIKIGRGAQVGAGAVVTKNVKPYSIVVGIPAKYLRMRKK